MKRVNLEPRQWLFVGVGSGSASASAPASAPAAGPMRWFDNDLEEDGDDDD